MGIPRDCARPGVLAPPRKRAETLSRHAVGYGRKRDSGPYPMVQHVKEPQFSVCENCGSLTCGAARCRRRPAILLLHAGREGAFSFLFAA